MKKYIYILVAVFTCIMFNSCGNNVPSMLYTAYTNTPFMTVKVFSGNAAKAEGERISNIINEVREVKKEKKFAGVVLGEETTYEKVCPQGVVTCGVHSRLRYCEPNVLTCTGNENKQFTKKLLDTMFHGFIEYFVQNDEVTYYFKDGGKLYTMTTTAKLYDLAYNELNAAPRNI